MNDWVIKLIKRLPVIFLLAVSLLFWGLYDRYESAGPVLLESPPIGSAIRLYGNCTETNGHYTLTVTEKNKPASINFRIPSALQYDMIQVSGGIKATGVVEGKYRWSCARLLLLQYDANNKWIPGYHSLKAISGTSDWAYYEDIFEIIPGSARADLVIQQHGISGTAEFDRLKAEPIRYRASYAVWRIVFSVLWLALAVYAFRICRLDRRRLRVLILLNAMAIMVGTLMPGKWIETVSEGMKDAIVRADIKTMDKRSESGSQPVKGNEQEGRKMDQFNDLIGQTHRLGHFLLFASLCFLVYLSAALEGQHPVYLIKVAFDLLLFAMITESLQYLTLDRTPGISDWLTDVYGIIAALLAFLMVGRLIPNSVKAKYL